LGHMVRECKMQPKTKLMVNNVRASKPTTIGHIFAISGTKASIYKANLICMSFSNLNDLSSNHIMINYVGKIFIFPNLEDFRFIIVNKAQASLEEEVQNI
ncbi:hypothetical protein CR513_37618, partial [Mucuna pruriens]